jgi:hypothetical protein
VGVLQRFERRLEGMVEGAFARAFKSELQPVEVASAVQREMDDRAAIVAQGRTLVPNDFVVEVAETDFDRLEVYADNLGTELATLARDYAKEQGYSFVGPVRMRFEGVPELTTGMFRIRSGVIRGHTVEAGEVRQPVSDLPRPQGGQFYGQPRLVVSSSSSGSLEAGSTYELQTPVTLLGRGTDCDLRMVDPGVSRHHAELRVEDDQVVLVDLGSTNGTFVNGQPARRVVLTDGTNVTLGRTTMVFRQDAQPGGYQDAGYQGNYDNRGYQGGYDNRGGYQGGPQGGGPQSGGYQGGYQSGPQDGGYQGGGYQGGYQGGDQGGGYQGGYDNRGYQDGRY